MGAVDVPQGVARPRAGTDALDQSRNAWLRRWADALDLPVGVRPPARSSAEYVATVLVRAQNVAARSPDLGVVVGSGGAGGAGGHDANMRARDARRECGT